MDEYRWRNGVMQMDEVEAVGTFIVLFGGFASLAAIGYGMWEHDVTALVGGFSFLIGVLGGVWATG